MSFSQGAWIGSYGGSEEVPRSLPDGDIALRAVRLDRSEVNGYYHGFANRTLWPLFHDLIQEPRFDSSWWARYHEVNCRFAATAEETVRRMTAIPVVWIHDYHLALVPSLLRGRVVAPIVFFLHIPFPPPELFARLPWRGEILRGLLGADVVAFHTERYRKNFVRTCGRLLPEVRVSGSRLVLPDGRVVKTAAHPISVDADDFASLARGGAVTAELARLRHQFGNKKVLLGVDRLDYTKGIPERLMAFERLLERRPELSERVTLVQIAVPSRGSVREYRELRERVELIVGRINGRFTEPGGEVPVHYIHRAVSRERLVAFYVLADVMVVTPLKDGMNLVAKEYVTCQGAVDGTGELLLSEFTGAALELREARQCNPFDVEGLSNDMEAAINGDPESARSAIRTMSRRIARHDVHRWAAAMISALDAPSDRRLPTEAYL